MAKLELADVEMEIFLANLVECADDPAFHDRPESFDCAQGWGRVLKYHILASHSTVPVCSSGMFFAVWKSLLWCPPLIRGVFTHFGQKCDSFDK